MPLSNWKSLFIKPEADSETTATPGSSESPAFSFPVNANPDLRPVHDPTLDEVMRAYESGLDSLNMPGYDFFEYYQAVISGEQPPGESVYRMAYRMARTMDKSVTAQKLITDAEFYIGKLNEVYEQYKQKGNQKIAELQNGKDQERKKLNLEIEQANRQMEKLRAELRKLETDVQQRRQDLDKLDGTFLLQEEDVRNKLSANDTARQICVGRLNQVRDGIVRYVKE